MANHPYENLSKLLHESNVYVGNNFIDMYNKCGSIVDAWKMFNTMLPMWDAIASNSMILGLVKCGQGKKVLSLFREMQ